MHAIMSEQIDWTMVIEIRKEGRKVAKFDTDITANMPSHLIHKRADELLAANGYLVTSPWQHTFGHSQQATIEPVTQPKEARHARDHHAE